MTKQDRATARLAQLVIAGAAPPRVMTAASAVVIELRAQGERGREQLEALRAEIDDGIAAAEDYAAEAGATDKPRALAQLSALGAAHGSLQLEGEQVQSDRGPGITAALRAAA